MKYDRNHYLELLQQFKSSLKRSNKAFKSRSNMYLTLNVA